jgi:integrase
LGAKASFEDAARIYRCRVQNDVKLSAQSVEAKLRPGEPNGTLRRTWPDLFDRELRSVTEAECRAWLVRIVRDVKGYTPKNARTAVAGNKPSTINKAIQFLKAVFEIGVENGVCRSNPAASLERLDVQKKEMHIPSPAQFREIVERIMAKAGWGRKAAALVQGLAYTGMRLDESRRLRWRHVELDRRVFTIPGTKSKTSRQRRVPMNGPFEELLRSLLPATPNPDGKVFKAGGAMESLRRACAEVGMARMTHHDCRHFFVVTALQAGVDVRTIATWLGHGDGGVLLLRTYGEYTAEHGAAMAAKMRFS